MLPVTALPNRKYKSFCILVRRTLLQLAYLKVYYEVFSILLIMKKDFEFVIYTKSTITNMEFLRTGPYPLSKLAFRRAPLPQRHFYRQLFSRQKQGVGVGGEGPRPQTVVERYEGTPLLAVIRWVEPPENSRICHKLSTAGTADPYISQVVLYPFRAWPLTRIRVMS